MLAWRHHGLFTSEQSPHELHRRGSFASARSPRRRCRHGSSTSGQRLRARYRRGPFARSALPHRRASWRPWGSLCSCDPAPSRSWRPLVSRRPSPSGLRGIWCGRFVTSPRRHSLGPTRTSLHPYTRISTRCKLWSIDVLKCSSGSTRTPADAARRSKSTPSFAECAELGDSRLVRETPSQRPSGIGSPVRAVLPCVLAEH